MVQKKVFLLISSVLLLACFVSSASGVTTRYVDDDGGADFIRIQDAVTNATAGDTIIVKNGTYTENIKVDKRLTVRSENGPDYTTVQAANSSDHVFTVTGDYVNVSGFTVTNVNGSETSGFYLFFVELCTISDNNASSNYYGIRLSYSNNNMLFNNSAYNNYNGITLSVSTDNIVNGNYANTNSFGGIYLYSSSNNTITANQANTNSFGGIYLTSSTNNTISSNHAHNNRYDGITLRSSGNNTIRSNHLYNNSFSGISLSSSANTIYNNYFNNNANNAWDEGNNTWNITKTAGTNIVGGSWLGGNYWADYSGIDSDGDGIGDTMLPYNSSGRIQYGGDYLPFC